MDYLVTVHLLDLQIKQTCNLKELLLDPSLKAHVVQKCMYTLKHNIIKGVLPPKHYQNALFCMSSDYFY